MAIDYSNFLFIEFPDLLNNLSHNAPAQWGRMNAHQMIEHLAQVLSISNGRFTGTANAEPERLAYRKMRFLEKDVPFSKGIRVDFVPEDPAPTMFIDIEQSKAFLMTQLQRFYDYHTEHADLKPIHPVFGELTYEEWIQFHARHTRHHFLQFGVID